MDELKNLKDRCVVVTNKEFLKNQGIDIWNKNRRIEW